MGIAAYLPVYIQGVIGDSATVSGFIIMAMSASGPVGALTAGQFMLRVSYRATASAGAAIYIIGSIMMSLLDAQSGVVWVMASCLLMGLGIGMNNNTYLVAVQSESAWNQRGIATSALMFSRILGQAMGAAAFGFRTAWINRTHLPAEYEPPPDATLAGLDELITSAP